MSYFKPFKPPVVVKRQVGAVHVWTMSGDWTRDLPLNVRRDASEKLWEPPDPLVVDMSAIAFLDQWGEANIAAILRSAVNEKKVVALVMGDHHVGWELAAAQEPVPGFDTVDDALFSLGEKSPELMHYRNLTEQLWEIRHHNNGEESVEEDALLDKMDPAWFALSEVDRKRAEEYQVGPDGAEIHVPGPDPDKIAEGLGAERRGPMRAGAGHLEAAALAHRKREEAGINPEGDQSGAE